jgi:hypothetical protein
LINSSRIGNSAAPQGQSSSLSQQLSKIST